MEYRVLPYGGENISVIGLGSGSISGTEDEMTALLEAAIEAGVNYFDMAPSMAAPFPAYARAFHLLVFPIAQVKKPQRSPTTPAFFDLHTRKNILRVWSSYLPNDVPGSRSQKWQNKFEKQENKRTGVICDGQQIRQFIDQQ